MFLESILIACSLILNEHTGADLNYMLATAEYLAMETDHDQ